MSETKQDPNTEQEEAAHSVVISQAAQNYLKTLLDKQEDELIIGVRMFINDPGTPRAETCIAYCRKSDIEEEHISVDFELFVLWIDRRSALFLREASIDHSEDRFGAQLSIKAPHSKLPRVGEDSSLEDRLNYLLYSEINPALASHGGEISLVEIIDGKTAVLRFGGGCQGCGMVDTTLKDGVERTLLERLPEITAVHDVTDHSDRSNAYL